MHLTNLAEAERALEAYWPSQVSKHQNNLDPVRKLLRAAGNPQNTLRVVHVAGTSGKTSTAYYVAALLKAAGKKVGLAVSPHVDNLNERVQLDLSPLPEAEFCAELGKYLELVKQTGVVLNHFELLYAFAYLQFARLGVDYAVVEVGVGGLLDATNTVDRDDKVCVITDIGLDHLTTLGNTLSEIAAQKAGIIQPGNAVFAYRQSSDIMAVIERTAHLKGAPLHVLEADAQAVNLGWLPLFQQRNLGLARAAADWTLQRDYGESITDAQVEAAAHIVIPGRMQHFRHAGREVIVDVAHNAQKLHALSNSVHQQYPGQPVAAMVSLIASRAYRIDDATREMVGLADHLIVTGFGGARQSVAPEVLAQACRGHGATSIEICADPATALQHLLQRPEPVLVATGSFFLLNYVRPLLTA